MPAEGGYVLASRLLTLYYFGFFLVILPLLGMYETPKPVPATIADSVLPHGGAKLQPAE